jgi:hypothetical protein
MDCEIFAHGCPPGSSPKIHDQQILANGRDLHSGQGKWTYFYRAVDKFGKTLDFMLSEHRDEAAASAFFACTIENNGWPEKGRHRQERGELGRAAKYELATAFAGMVLAD